MFQRDEIQIGTEPVLVDGVIDNFPLKLIPLSTKLKKLAAEKLAPTIGAHVLLSVSIPSLSTSETIALEINDKTGDTVLEVPESGRGPSLFLRK